MPLPSDSVLGQLASAAQRLPVLAAGAPADLANTILGGYKNIWDYVTSDSPDLHSGLSDEPVLGTKQLLRVAGLPQDSGGLVQDSAEAIGSLLSPGAAVKGAIAGAAGAAKILSAGMILPARATHSLQEIMAASKMEAAGADAKSIYDKFTRTSPEGEVTGGLFKGSSQVDATRVGWKGIIDDSAATWKQGSLDVTDGRFTPKSGQTLKDVLDHPRLTEIMKNDPAMEKILNARITVIPFDGTTLAHYVPGANEIGLSSAGSTKDLMSWLLHETQHAIQFETGMGQGSNSTYWFKNKDTFNTALENAKKAVTAAKNPKDLQQATTDFKTLDALKDKAYARYKQAQGEVEARTTEAMFTDPRQIPRFQPEYPAESATHRDQMTQGSEWLSKRAQRVKENDYLDTPKDIKALIRRYQ